MNINVLYKIKPMLAKVGKLPKEDTEYAYEIKWDGLRAILYIENGQVKISSRNLKDITAQYPELQKIGHSFNSQTAILDGEIVVLDEENKPSFSLLQHRMGLVSPAEIMEKARNFPVTYMIFDLLDLNGNAFLHSPYVERQKALSALELSGAYWQTPGYKTQNGKTFLEATKRLGLEGIIAKRLTSLYHPGYRTGDWLKIKNQRRQELILAGWTPGKGSRKGTIGAVLTGYFDHPNASAEKRNLIFAGKVGTGFNRSTLEKLEALFKSLETSVSPYAGKIPLKEEIIFVKPTLVGEFEFTEWTPNGTMRHPSFKGLRQDKNPDSIIKEE